MLGLQKLGIGDPQGNKEDRKRLVTFVEIYRCATDAVAVVTGCRLGKRALKFRDWGTHLMRVTHAGPVPALAGEPAALKAPARSAGTTGSRSTK